MGKLAERLRAGHVVLDGGFATELERLGFDTQGPLWSARAIREAPSKVMDVHAQFAAAGADVLCTASYQASRQGFAAVGLSDHDADQAIAESVALAQRAAPGKLIALSLGSYGAACADGSEYTGRFTPPAEGLSGFHRHRLEAGLQQAPDALAFETLPSLEEIAAVLVVAAEVPDLDVWVSCSLQDEGHLGSGEPVEALAALSLPINVVAIGFNCAAAPVIAGAAQRVATCWRAAGAQPLPLVAYPHRGERYEAGRGWDASTASDPWASTADLARAGVGLWGGCCRTTPDDLRQLVARVRQLEPD